MVEKSEPQNKNKIVTFRSPKKVTHFSLSTSCGKKKKKSDPQKKYVRVREPLGPCAL